MEIVAEPYTAARRSWWQRGWNFLGRRLLSLGVAGLAGLDKMVHWLAERDQTFSVDFRARLASLLDRPQRMVYDRHAVWLTVGSRAEKMRLRSAQKEPWTVRWIESHVRPGDVFYDIGANVGAYALIAAKVSDQQARIYAFEPGFNTFASLCHNVLINVCQQCVFPLPIALSDRTGLARFKYRTVSAGGASHALGNRALAPAEGDAPAAVYEQQILAYRLDDVIEQFGLPVPSHIKLDVDGAECEVLRGAPKLLANPRLRTLLLEIDEEAVDGFQLIKTMTSHGFQLVSRGRRGEGEKGFRPTFYYGLFAREQAPAEPSAPSEAA